MSTGAKVKTQASAPHAADTHDVIRVVFEGTPADVVADRSTLTGQHLATYVGT